MTPRTYMKMPYGQPASPKDTPSPRTVRDAGQGTIFDRHDEVRPWLSRGAFSTVGSNPDGLYFRRDSKDRREAKSVVTAKLMGDPTPEQLARRDARERSRNPNREEG